MNNLDKQYLEILNEILENGVKKTNRTGVDTLSVFGKQIKHNMAEGFPLLTTKRVPFRIVKEELLWFISGSSDIRDLWKNKVHIWDGDWYKNYLNSTSVPYTLEKMIKMGTQKNRSQKFHDSIWDLGKIYGFQWRHWNGHKSFNSITSELKYTRTGIDQLKNLLNDLKENPDSRRLMVTAWNPQQLSQMVLPPCHYGFQVWARELTRKERADYLAKRVLTGDLGTIGKEEIDLSEVDLDKEAPRRGISLLWNQRSCDFPLGIPFNIASYGILLLMLADEVGMVPEMLIGNFGDCHIYEDQISGVLEQLEREPRKLPTLHIRDGMHSCGEGDFILENYNPHPTIKFPLSN